MIHWLYPLLLHHICKDGKEIKMNAGKENIKKLLKANQKQVAYKFLNSINLLINKKG